LPVAFAHVPLEGAVAIDSEISSKKQEEKKKGRERGHPTLISATGGILPYFLL